MDCNPSVGGERASRAREKEDAAARAGGGGCGGFSEEEGRQPV
jgi:hypothetical protein